MEVKWIDCNLLYCQYKPKRFDYFSYPVAEAQFKDLLQKENGQTELK